VLGELLNQKQENENGTGDEAVPLSIKSVIGLTYGGTCLPDRQIRPSVPVETMWHTDRAKGHR